MGKGLLPSEKVIAEHYRLGSTCTILSRNFCNTNVITDLDEVRRIFNVDLKAIHNWEKQCTDGEVDFVANKKEVENAVSKIIKGLE